MAYTECYVQTTGSNLNAGSTNTDAATLTYASGNWGAGTGIFTVASGDPVTDGVAVGDWASVYPDGSTVAVFIGRVTARTIASITVSLTDKSGTAPTDGAGNRTLKIGGAWKGPNGTEAFPFGFIQATHRNSSSDMPRVNIKGGTNYNITAAMTHANAGSIRFEGYTTTIGDKGRFTVDGGTSGASYVLLTVSVANIELHNAIFQNNGSTGSANGLVFSSSEHHLDNVIAHDIRGSGIVVNGTGNTHLIDCETYLCNQSNSSGLAGFALSAASIYALGCMAHDNSGSNTRGFTISGAAHLTRCIADTNGSIGFSVTATTNVMMLNCDAYNNVSHGISASISSAGLLYFDRCILTKNGTGGTGYGIDVGGSGKENGCIRNCAFGSGTAANTSGDINGTDIEVRDKITLASNTLPYVDAPNGDFRINLASVQDIAHNFVQTQSGYAGTVGYLDAGAAHHQGGGGSSGGLLVHRGMAGGFRG